MDRLRIAASNMPSEHAGAGLATYISLKQRRLSPAQAPDFNNSCQRPGDGRERRHILVDEASRLSRGPARNMNLAIREVERCCEIVGKALAAQLAEERESNGNSIIIKPAAE